MAYKITDSCVACGTCIGECPVEGHLGRRHLCDRRRQMYRLRHLRRRLPERGDRFGVTTTYHPKKTHSGIPGAFFFFRRESHERTRKNEGRLLAACRLSVDRRGAAPGRGALLPAQPAAAGPPGGAGGDSARAFRPPGRRGARSTARSTAISERRSASATALSGTSTSRSSTRRP